ncbi:MAG: M3 family metallopeptidase [Lacunisphaera sp.]
MKTSALIPSLVIASSFLVTAFGAAPEKLADFQQAAAKANLDLSLPDYPKSPDEVREQVNALIKDAESKFAIIAAQDPSKATFASTFAAYDSVGARVGTAGEMLDTVAESAIDKALRDAANEATVKLESWGVGIDYREDLYRVLKVFADTKPALDAQQQRLVDFQLRSYRRAGLSLPPAEKSEVERLRKDLAELNTQFSVNINEARAPLIFTLAELDGVPASFLESPGVKQPDGTYRAYANITWHRDAILENARREATRQRMAVARKSLAMAKNIPVLAKLVVLRADIAHRLGYANWADYQTEIRMAKNGATALKFEQELVAGLQPKFDAEMKGLNEMKAKDTGDADAKVNLADVPYYQNQLKKQRYDVDTEALRVYFPYQATLEGMFAIYQKIFGLKFTEVTPPYAWAPGVQLYVVQDSATGVPMGAFYLDMFPREGKFNHFACFSQKSGRFMANGHYELPIAALLCNFPAPSADKPSLLKHSDVETLFHEFGHVMHMLLGRSRYASQGAFNVPQDFVEAPSQMLENWVWDKNVLDTFAADYRDKTKKIPAETIKALIAARQATDGYYYRRQLAIGLLDLKLHMLSPDEAWLADVAQLTNKVTGDVTIPPPAHTAWVAYIGHLAGYDAGYYGYLWSKVMAMDMANEFREAPGGFLDEKVGRRLRDEVYGVGNTRDVGVSVEKFLGRPRSQQPFLDDIGIGK